MTEKQLLVLSKKNCVSKLIKIQTVGTSIKLVETTKKKSQNVKRGYEKYTKGFWFVRPTWWLRRTTSCERPPLIREVKHHAYVKRRTRICTTWPSFLFTCRLLCIISTPKLAVPRNFSPIRIVLSCFYLLIFYFEKFSTLIWRLPFAVYVKLKLSISDHLTRSLIS